MRARTYVRAALASAFAVALLVVALPAESFVQGLTAGGWTTTAKVSSSAPRPGDTVTITGAVTSNKNRTALVSLEVFSPTLGRVHQRVWDAQAFTRMKSRTYSTTFKVPAKLAGERLVVKVGVFGPGWLQWYQRFHWNDGATAFKVTSATAASTTTTAPTTTTTVPSTTDSTESAALVWRPEVDATGATDVSNAMATFFAKVPDGATIELRAGGTYRMEQGFTISGRRNLTIRGNGATFVATSKGVSTRVSVRIEDSSGISVFNLRVVGANPMAGAKDRIFRPELSGQHGFGISRSTDVLLSGVSVRDTYGDFVYMGRWGGDAYTDGVHIQGSTFARSGRQGITMTGARNVIVETSTITEAKRSTFDFEPGSGAGSTVEYVTIRNNTISRGALSFVSAEGHGPVDHITIRGNRLSGMPLSITMEDLDGGLRRDWKVFDNTSDLPAGGAQGATMRFVRIVGLEVGGNVQPMKPDRGMYLVGVTNGCNLSVSGNTFPNGVGELRTTGTC